jgi:hypothetical protein
MRPLMMSAAMQKYHITGAPASIISDEEVQDRKVLAFTLFSQAIHVRCMRARYQHRTRNETGMTYSVWAHQFAKGGLRDRRCASCACRTPATQKKFQTKAAQQRKAA